MLVMKNQQEQEKYRENLPGNSRYYSGESQCLMNKSSVIKEKYLRKCR